MNCRTKAARRRAFRTHVDRLAAWNWFRGQMLASSVAAVRADGRRMGAALRRPVAFTDGGAGAAPTAGSTTTAHGATTP